MSGMRRRFRGGLGLRLLPESTAIEKRIEMYSPGQNATRDAVESTGYTNPSLPLPDPPLLP